jgi:hypothetical protein
MQSIDIIQLKKLAIILIYTVLMGTAAWDKVKGMKAPEWFVKQFENTIIAKMPGGAVFGFWVIAIFESLLTLCFVGALFNSGLLAWALTGSLFLFGILCFGLRLINEFQGSANMFIYFAATLLSLACAN